jgi:phosphotransferase system enzyme I (PtsI)
MIETPAAALISDILAKHVDFFSIGTNDLIQYTLACDRGNEKVAYLYEPLHPAVLRLIKTVVDNAHKNKIKVCVCGEMASEMENAIILTGLGIDELSMSTLCLLDVKKAIREINYSEIKVFVEELLDLNSYGEVLKKVRSFLRKNLKMYI